MEHFSNYIFQAIVTLSATVGGIKMSLNGLRGTIKNIDQKVDNIGSQVNENHVNTSERLARLEERTGTRPGASSTS